MFYDYFTINFFGDKNDNTKLTVRANRTHQSHAITAYDDYRWLVFFIWLYNLAKRLLDPIFTNGLRSPIILKLTW